MLTEEEQKFYRDFYKVMSDERTEKLLKQYAQIQLDKQITTLRHKNDMYEYAYANGAADAWQQVKSLKLYLIKIMQEIS